jgi:ankyrin repeat protein
MYSCRSVDGQTPVHIAAAWSRAHILHLLLLNGGDPWLHDCDGNNAFHYAYKERHWNVVEILESFCITDSSKEEDASEEKYILTFGKLHLSQCLFLAIMFSNSVILLQNNIVLYIL